METIGGAVGEAVRLEELARLRQAAYRLFATILLNPDAEWLATLPRVAEEMLPESRPFDQFPFWGEWEGLLTELAGFGEPERAALEDVYVNQFMVSSGPGKSPPYESSYVAQEAIPDLMADLEGEYGRSGFELSPILGETSDHGAVELEFMSVLCAAESEAWAGERLGEGVEILERQKKFLEAHLNHWFPVFAERAAGKEKEDFYARAAGAARAFIAHEVDLLDFMIGRLREGEVK